MPAAALTPWSPGPASACRRRAACRRLRNALAGACEHRVERLAWLAPDRGPRSEPEVLAVLDGVQQFSLRYLGPAGASQAWDGRWRMPGHPELPRAVEITLELERGGTLVRVFDLPAAP